MKKLIQMFSILCMVFVLLMSSFTAAERLSPEEVYDKYKDSLSTQKEMQLDNWVAAMQFDAYQEFYDGWICSGALGDGKVIEILLNEGYYVEYYNEIKAAGLIRADYELPSASKKTSDNVNANAQSAPPSPVKTTKCDEKTMWAKSAVNVRENGSTSYKKVASLIKDEQVTVTGIDSTGWYEIRKADGTVGHVSDKYLTEVDPSVSAVSEETITPSELPKKQSEIISIDGRTVVWYNAETDREEEVTFNEETPLEDIEEYANIYLINGGFVEEATPEPTEEPEETPTPVVTATPERTPTPTVEPTVNQTTEPENEDTIIHRVVYSPVFIFGCMIVGLCAIVTGIVMMVRGKRK